MDFESCFNLVHRYMHFSLKFWHYLGTWETAYINLLFHLVTEWKRLNVGFEIFYILFGHI